MRKKGQCWARLGANPSLWKSLEAQRLLKDEKVNRLSGLSCIEWLIESLLIPFKKSINRDLRAMFKASRCSERHQ